MQEYFESSADWTQITILCDPKECIFSTYLDKEVYSSRPLKENYFRSKCYPMIAKCKSIAAEECYKQERKFSFREFGNAIKTCADIH